MADEQMIYDPIEIEPMDVLFDKLTEARGGEMLLIHLPPELSDIECFIAKYSSDSRLMAVLPTLAAHLQSVVS